MQCNKTKYLFCNGFKSYKLFFIGTFRKLNSSVWYAGLIVCLFVPFALCDLNSTKLTYEEIYNKTKYAQIQNENLHRVPLNYSLISNINAKESNLEYTFKDKYELSKRGQLLVGFARDPYRLSIPEADYLNGVRNIDINKLSKGDRGKRGVVHLYNMLTCATGCDPISYKGYGCYCGFLGSGRPTDPIDNCCKLHDECYENIYCPFYTVYFQPYYWKCYHGEPLCALENYKTRHQFINGCAGRLCECDRRFAMCVRKYHCPGRPALCWSSPLRLLQNLLMTR